MYMFHSTGFVIVDLFWTSYCFLRSDLWLQLSKSQVKSIHFGSDIQMSFAKHER